MLFISLVMDTLSVVAVVCVERDKVEGECPVVVVVVFAGFGHGSVVIVAPVVKYIQPV